MTDTTKPEGLNKLASIVSAAILAQVREALSHSEDIWQLIDKELTATLEEAHKESAYRSVVIEPRSGDCLVTLLGALDSTIAMPFELASQLDYEDGIHAHPPSAAQIEDAEHQASAWQEFAGRAVSTAKRATEIADRMKRLAQ